MEADEAEARRLLAWVTSVLFAANLVSAAFIIFWCWTGRVQVGGVWLALVSLASVALQLPLVLRAWRAPAEKP